MAHPNAGIYGIHGVSGAGGSSQRVIGHKKRSHPNAPFHCTNGRFVVVTAVVSWRCRARKCIRDGSGHWKWMAWPLERPCSSTQTGGELHFYVKAGGTCKNQLLKLLVLPGVARILDPANPTRVARIIFCEHTKQGVAPVITIGVLLYHHICPETPPVLHICHHLSSAQG